MSLLNDPSHWRMRASDLRRLADAALDLVYRAKLQKIAASYDLLAVRALARFDSVTDMAPRHPASHTPMARISGTGPLASEGLQDANVTRPP
jgi:hypothetical protein